MKFNNFFSLKLFFISLFLFLFTITFFINRQYKNTHIEFELLRQSNLLQTNFNINNFHNRRDVEAINYSIMHMTWIAEIMKEAYTADETRRDFLREKLYKQLIHKYKAMRHRGVLQFQFVFPDNITFLRMHKSKKFGDDLSDIRYTFVYTNKTHEPIFGFESGRTVHAFRNIFPMFDTNGSYVGAYEVSHSSDSVQQALTKANKIHSHFLVHKHAFDVNTWKIKNDNSEYLPSIEHKDYKFSVKKDEMYEIEKKLLQGKKALIEKKMNKSEKFTIYVEDEAKIIAIAFLPIKDTKSETLAYIVSYAENVHILEILKNYEYINIIALIMLILLSYLLYKQMFLKTRLQHLNKHLEEDVIRQTRENIKKDKILQEQAKLVSMGEMVGAIAHQWRQPLNVLNINIQNLDDDYADGLINKEFIDDFIYKQSQTIVFMSHTIDDFRNFFRVDKIKKEFSVIEAIKETLAIQEAAFKNNNILVSIIGEDFTITSLKNEFNQVILNILSNAKDAIIEEQIEEGKITITLTPKHISILDNAGGIDEKILNRIFEPYFTTKEQGYGTGIGLYMSKMIIEQNLGGTLSAHNAKDGAIFIIKLGA